MPGATARAATGWGSPSRPRSAAPWCATAYAAALREIYRLHEGDFRRGYDIVVVARHRAAQAEYARLERELLRAAAELKLLAEEAEA